MGLAVGEGDSEGHGISEDGGTLVEDVPPLPSSPAEGSVQFTGERGSEDGQNRHLNSKLNITFLRKLVLPDRICIIPVTQ